MPAVKLPSKPSAFSLGIIVEMMLLLGAFVSGLITAGAAGVTQSRFDGHCPLSVSVTCESVGSTQHEYKFHWTNDGLCNFCVNLQIAGVVASFLFTLYRIIVLCYRKYNIGILRIVTTGAFSIYTILVLADAALITSGFNSFCNSLISACTVHSDKSCFDFQTFLNWSIIKVDGSSFYSTLRIAEVAAWISVLFWVALSIWNIVLFVSARRANRQMVLPPSSSSLTTAAPTAVNKPL
ncbi:transmembrane protein 179B-like [Acanthaster planci]|uniref:Transmembrane protein 179B-like n=1 Tax=Acanthaster planci TaxID=133434 RepID=A0A8B7YPQ3_ACAPL|nr:transmembrane protein 179B-like [Acanthaster planci]